MPAFIALVIAKLLEFFIPKIPGYLAEIFSVIKSAIDKKLAEKEYDKRVEDAILEYKESSTKDSEVQERAFENLINTARRS